MASILSHPSLRTEPVRNTAACACMVCKERQEATPWLCLYIEDSEGLDEVVMDCLLLQSSIVQSQNIRFCDAWLPQPTLLSKKVVNNCYVPSACWAWSQRFSGFHWQTSVCPGWPQTPPLHWPSEGTISLLKRKTKRQSQKTDIILPVEVLLDIKNEGEFMFPTWSFFLT